MRFFHSRFHLLFIYRSFSFSSLTHSFTAVFRFHLLLIHLPQFFVFTSYSFIYRSLSFSSLTHSFTALNYSSYITLTMDIICSGCYKTIKTKNTVCENCLKYYHPSCTALTQVRKNDKLISVYRTCIATANASKQRRNSVKSVDNEPNEHKNSTTDPSTAFPSGSSESSATCQLYHQMTRYSRYSEN